METDEEIICVLKRRAASRKARWELQQGLLRCPLCKELKPNNDATFLKSRKRCRSCKPVVVDTTTETPTSEPYDPKKRGEPQKLKTYEQYRNIFRPKRRAEPTYEA